MSDRPAMQSGRIGAIATAATLGSIAFGGTVGVARRSLAEGVSIVAALLAVGGLIGLVKWAQRDYIGEDRQAAHTREIAEIKEYVAKQETRIVELGTLVEALQKGRLKDRLRHEHERAVDQRRYVMKLTLVWSHVLPETRLLLPPLKELLNGDWEPEPPLTDPT